MSKLSYMNLVMSEVFPTVQTQKQDKSRFDPGPQGQNSTVKIKHQIISILNLYYRREGGERNDSETTHGAIIIDARWTD